MNDDGSMARLPDLEVFAKTHGLKIGTIASLIEHRRPQRVVDYPASTSDSCAPPRASSPAPAGATSPAVRT